MKRHNALRILWVIAATFVAMAPGAAAQPLVDPAALPAQSRPSPPEPTEQRTECARPAPTPAPTAIPLELRQLRFADVWPLTRGAGQLVAIIDTGVTPHPLLPNLVAGGDYVSTGDGLDDCDAHGTVVAGLVAGQASPASGFAGGAPDASILSIRQSSSAFAAADTAEVDEVGAVTSVGYGDVDTLAAAVRTAADSGATVINISEVACGPAVAGDDASLGDRALGAAVRYAAVDRDVVVVAAAGNLDGRRCREQNPVSHGVSTRWSTAVSTVASPAWFDDLVLTVASLDPDGRPSSFGLAGPWVDVAAPGTDLTSTSSSGTGMSSGVFDTEGRVSPYSGTSFATPLVSATAALIRARFPDMSARDVVARIERTAHSPAGGWNSAVGFGGIDPVAAVTGTAFASAAGTGPVSLGDRPVAVTVDRGPGRLAIAAAIALIAVATVISGGAAVHRTRRRGVVGRAQGVPTSDIRPS